MTNAVSQKEGVFNAVSSVVDVVDGEQVELNDSQRQTVLSMLSTALADGSIIVSEAKRNKMKTDKDHIDYAKNILSNWLAKDLRLNGGEPHQIKKPGSRAGAGDDMIRELKRLLKTPQVQANDEAKAEIEAAIQERLAELQATRNAANIEEINFDLIPQFAHLVK